MPCGKVSSPDITVAPVVVSPEIDSKIASTIGMPQISSGSAPASPPVSHTDDVSTKVCTRVSGRRRPRLAAIRNSPSAPASTNPSPKTARVSG